MAVAECGPWALARLSQVPPSCSYNIQSIQFSTRNYEAEEERARKGQKSIFEEIRWKTSQLWWETWIYTSKKFNELQGVKTDHKRLYDQTTKTQRQIQHCRGSKRRGSSRVRTLSKTNSWFLVKNYGSHRQWYDIFKVLKEKYCQTRIIFLEKLSFKNEEVKTFPCKQKLREFITGRLAYKKH